jgi:O-antigen/teichoic acid export membrane protein
VGIIQRQSTIGTVIIYSGTIIGFITSSLIFPHILSSEEIGLISVLVAYAMIISRFAGLGFNTIGNRLFPYFRNPEKGHNGFLFLALTTSLIGFILASVLFGILRPYLIESRIEDSALLASYIDYIIPLVFSIIFFLILDTYYRLLFNAVIGTFLKEFLQRFLILIFIVIFYYTSLSFEGFLMLYMAAFALPLLIIILSLIRQKQFLIKPDFQIMTKSFTRSVLTVGMFGILVSFSGAVILNVDRIMIEEFLGLSATGIFATTFYFGVLVGIPARPLIKISSTVIAEAWKKDDRETISTVYSKACLNQFILGLLLFLGIWLNQHNIFSVLPAEYAAGKYVILFIGLTYLAEMFTGACTAVLSTSELYKYLAYFMLLLIILVVVTNILFIPIWGITGAALAALFSRSIVFFLRYLFLYKRFGFQPYNPKFLLVFLIGGITFLAGWLIPILDNYIIDFLIRGSVITIVFILLIYFLKPSEEIDGMMDRMIARIKK